MKKSRKFITVLSVASLAAIVTWTVPRQSWASGGGDGGDGGAGFQLRYSEEEDDDDTQTYTGTEQPVDWRSIRLGYFSSKLWGGSDFKYRAEDSAETPTSFTVKYANAALNFDIGSKLRFRWRYELSDELDESDDTDQPAIATSVPKFMYKFQTWTNFDVLEDVEEDPLKGLDPDKYVWDDEEGLGYRVGNFLVKLDMTPEMARRFEEWGAKEVTRNGVANWLGDKAFDKFQAEFGTAAGNVGAENQSEWSNTYLYCGGTCVGLYY
jgi:hypothetical protein